MMSVFGSKKIRRAVSGDRVAGGIEPLLAVKPGASGDISLTQGETTNEFVAWFQPRAAADTSSPLVFGGRVYAVNDTGIRRSVPSTWNARCA